MKDHSYQLILDSIVADYPLTVEEASRVVPASIYLLARDGFNGCFWHLSVRHGRSDWITGQRFGQSPHQRNGRKEMIQLKMFTKATAKPRF